MSEKNSADNEGLKDDDLENLLRQSFDENLAVSAPQKKSVESKQNYEASPPKTDSSNLAEPKTNAAPKPEIEDNESGKNAEANFDETAKLEDTNKALKDKAVDLTDDVLPASKEDRKMEVLLDLPLDVSVILGSTNLKVSDLLLMGQGSIIELDKLLGDRLDIFVNDRPIATGNIVLSSDVFGCKVSHILSPTERLKKLVFEK